MNKNVCSAKELNEAQAQLRLKILDSQIRKFPSALASSSTKRAATEAPEGQLPEKVRQPLSANPIGKPIGDGSFAFTSTTH